jgi:GT2 family glycosyltransferase
MLSDDCLVVPGAIRNGIETFEQHMAQGERVGAVAFYWRNWPDDEQYKVGLTFGDRMFVNHGLYLHSAMEEVGFVDEEAFSFYHADGDLGLRMWEAGYACVDAPGSLVEHYLDANHAVRASNYERQQADWSAYRDRWGHLGESRSEWLERPLHDPADTARRFWGRRRTNPFYRALTLYSSAVRTRRLGVLGDVRRRLFSR